MGQRRRVFASGVSVGEVKEWVHYEAALKWFNRVEGMCSNTEEGHDCISRQVPKRIEECNQHLGITT
jgi:hypothetical protein